MRILNLSIEVFLIHSTREVIALGTFPMAKVLFDCVKATLESTFEVHNGKITTFRMQWLNFIQETYKNFVNPLMPHKSGSECDVCCASM